METIEVTADHLRHRIPAPIDAECLTSPAQIEPRDHVMVHAMGSWYPGVVLNVRPKSGKLEVEYTSGTRTVRRTIVARQALVPSMCGYPRRTHGGEAAAWAAAVWAALEAYRAPSMTTIGKDVSEGIAALNAATVKAFDEGTLPTIDAGRVMTDGPDRNAGGPKIKIRVADDAGTRAAVESARAALGPRKVRRRVTMSVRLPVSVELLVESEDEVGVGGVDVEDTTFHVLEVEAKHIQPGYTPSEIHETLDEDELAELDRLARAADDEEE